MDRNHGRRKTFATPQRTNEKQTKPRHETWDVTTRGETTKIQHPQKPNPLSYPPQTWRLSNADSNNKTNQPRPQRNHRNPRRRPLMAQSRDKCNRPNAPQNENIPTEITQQEPKTALQHKMQQTSKPIFQSLPSTPNPLHTPNANQRPRPPSPTAKPTRRLRMPTPKPTRRLQKPPPIPKANSTASDAAVDTQTPHAHEAHRTAAPSHAQANCYSNGIARQGTIGKLPP